MTIRGLLPAFVLGAALVTPNVVGADDDRWSRGGRSGDRYDDRYDRHHHRYDRHHRRHDRNHHYYGPRYDYWRDRGYRRHDPYRVYYYRPYYPHHRHYYRPRYRRYAPVYPVPYGAYPVLPLPPHRGGVHGGVHLGLPGFGFSLYF